MIFDRISILRSVFGHNDRAAGVVSSRWKRAFAHEPDLARDVIISGGLLMGQPVNMVEGNPQSPSIDPYVLAYEAGRRDHALQLLAQGGISYDELNQLMEAKEL